MFRAADSNLRDARRSLTSPFAAVSLVFRRRRGFAASVARRSVAFLAAAFLFAFSGVFVLDARAQLFKNGPFAPGAPSSNSRDASASRKTPSAPNPPQTERPQLFSGKYVRSLADNFSRDDAPRSASSNPRQTPPRQSVQRSNVPTPAPAPRSNASLSTSSESLESLTQASTSRDSAREIAAKIPWNAFSPSTRQKLQELVSNPTIYRRLPMAGGRCNPELFDFLLCNPHAVVAFWNQMGFDDLSMSEKGPYRYEIREKTGTVGGVQILYQDAELAVVYCSGTYRGPVMPRALEGEMLLLLQTRYTEDEANRPIVVCRLDAFVDLKNPGADLIARTISGPLGKIADSNFEQTVAFIDSLSQTAETAPNELLSSISQLDSLSPQTRRLLSAKAVECARQAGLRAQGELVEYRLLPKKNLPTETFARILAREQNGVYAAQASTRRPPHNAANPQTQPPRRNGTAGFAQSSPSRSGSLYSSSSTFADDFDRPSLAKNSFALANDADGSANVESNDFESSIDWDDENALDAPSVSSLTPETRTPQTSLAKVGARPASKFSNALELLEENDLTTPQTSASPALELSTDAPTTTDIADETVALPAFSVDENATADALFDSETLVDLDASSATETTPSADETVALPIFAENSTPNAAAPVRTRRLPTPPRRIPSAKPSPLIASESLQPTSEAQPLAENAVESHPDENAELPLLLLPDFDANSAAPQAVETEIEAAPLAEPQAAELAPEFAAQSAPSADKADDEPILTAAVPTISVQSGTVWRAVKVDDAKPTKSRQTPRRPSAAQPKVAGVEKARVEKTAQAETQDNEGVTFRKPRFQ